MFRFKFAAALTAILCVAGAVFSQEDVKPPEVDFSEAVRRGDMVVTVGEGPRGAEQEAIIAATAPPADDSHMWYVTVFVQEGCEACKQLKEDFKTSPLLMSFVAASEPAKAWAHLNYYDVKDDTQKDRIKRYKINGTPTVVIQPPRNGMWGDPALVVDQIDGYDNDPKKLATRMSYSVRLYAAKAAKAGYPKHFQSLLGQYSAAPTSGAAQAPPFNVPSSDPFTPQPSNNPFPSFPPTPSQPATPATPAPAPVPMPWIYLITTLLGSNLFISVAKLVVPMLKPRVDASPGKIDDLLLTLVTAFLEGKTPPKNVLEAAKRRIAR